jgi:flagellin-like hook-associated protein FlgL
MTGAVTLRFNTQAQSDIRRMMRELSDLQRQTASGSKSNDLSGYGAGAARLINAQSLRTVSDAQSSTTQQMIARFGVQAQALDQVATSTADLASSIRSAISANDGRGIMTDLQLSFSSTVSAMNESWNGQPLFAGQRTDTVSVLKISKLDDLTIATTDQQLYNESENPQTYTLSGGAVVQLADKASDLSRDLFSTFRDLNAMIVSAGGQLGGPLTPAQIDQLSAFADKLDSHSQTFLNAEGQAGQLEKRFGAEQSRLDDRSNLLAKEIGDQSDVDLAQVSIQISSLLAQYQAAAKVFSDVSKLSLLNYL